MLWQSSQIEKKVNPSFNNTMLIKRDRFQRKIYITYTINLPLFCDPIQHDRTITKKKILENKTETIIFFGMLKNNHCLKTR